MKIPLGDRGRRVNVCEMEEIAFKDWPGQPVDLNCGPWLPAYGFQTPTALLEREDFVGNPGKKPSFSNAIVFKSERE